MKETSKILILIYIFLIYILGIVIAFEITFPFIISLQRISHLYVILFNLILFMTVIFSMLYFAFILNKIHKQENELKDTEGIQTKKSPLDHVFLLNILLCTIIIFSSFVVFILYGNGIATTNHNLISRIAFIIFLLIGFSFNLKIIYNRLLIKIDAKAHHIQQPI